MLPIAILLLAVGLPQPVVGIEPGQVSRPAPKPPHAPPPRSPIAVSHPVSIPYHPQTPVSRLPLSFRLQTFPDGTYVTRINGLARLPITIGFGTVLTIDGAGFGSRHPDSNVALFSPASATTGVFLTIDSWSDTHIVARMPAGASIPLPGGVARLKIQGEHADGSLGQWDLVPVTFQP